MYITVNLFLIIFALGAIQGLIVASLILFKRKQPIFTYYFGALLLILALGSIKIILQEIIPDFNNWFPIPLVYQFASGPLLYLFVREALWKNAHTLRQLAPHFIPMLLIDLIYRAGIKWLGFDNGSPLIQQLNFATNMLALVSYFTYTLLSIRQWYLYQKNTQSYRPASQQRLFFWIKRLIIVDLLSTLAVVAYIGLTLYQKSFFWGGIRTYYIPYTFLTAYIYFLSYMAYLLPEIKLLSPQAENLIPKEKQRSNTPTDYTAKAAAMQAKVIEQAWYTDPELNLQKLAALLNTPQRELSMLINQGTGKNFNDFINALRVAYLKQLLLQEQNQEFSIEGMAFEAGFKSKPSFYRAFKKETGQTPGQFQKEQLEKAG